MGSFWEEDGDANKVKRKLGKDQQES